jgi:hypothetical protein
MSIQFTRPDPQFEVNFFIVPMAKQVGDEMQLFPGVTFADEVTVGTAGDWSAIVKVEPGFTGLPCSVYATVNVRFIVGIIRYASPQNINKLAVVEVVMAVNRSRRKTYSQMDSTGVCFRPIQDEE